MVTSWVKTAMKRVEKRVGVIIGHLVGAHGREESGKGWG